MKQIQITFISIVFFLAISSLLLSQETAEKAQPSSDTEICLACHGSVHPGIVADWQNSRHSMITPSDAIAKPELERRVSSDIPPVDMGDNSVGCAECHTMNAGKHPDSFDHNGYRIHTVVSPSDCAVCHDQELEQYSQSVKYYAYRNLMGNPVYMDLANTINNINMIPTPREQSLEMADSCLYCHGTVVMTGELVTRKTSMGQMEFPEMTGWPNQGVGRINPDNSLGCCTSCHPRHTFSIETARKPETCAECHKGPDVPAYKVYAVSKHGNIYSAKNSEWNFDAVPWKVGEDFSAPTCSACHVSLIASPDGKMIVERSHSFSDRLANRIFGPIFAIPHPKSGDTTIMKSPSGLPLPVDLDATLAKDFLIDENEMKIRTEKMHAICSQCHSKSWIDGNYELLQNTIKTTNGIVLETNKLMMEAWANGAAKGLADSDSLFNEYIERLWVEQWLFYANSVRFAAAMGGADLGVFENGRWQMSKTLQEIKEIVAAESEED